MNTFNNYKYFKSKNKIYALSTYAGKTVRGVAKCAPGDSFNEEKGKELAAARCNLKVAKKRLKRAHKLFEDSVIAMTQAKVKNLQMKQYYQDANVAYSDAQLELRELEKSM